MLWMIMADAVAAFHAAYIVFVVVGLAAILVGSLANWKWVRSPIFRILHLAAIAQVCLEALAEVICPLTRLESALRVRAGQSGYGRDFIGYWVDRFIFHDAPPWVFTAVYLSFGALVLLTFWIVPARSFRSERQ